MTSTTEHMWIADFVRAGSRGEAFAVAEMMTRNSVADESVLGLLALAQTDRGCAIAIARHISSQGSNFLAWTWRAYAVEGSSELALVASQGIELVNMTSLPPATVSNCLARLRVWRKMSAAMLGAESALDIFDMAGTEWRKELEYVSENEMRARKAFAPPVSLLWSKQWDEAAFILRKATVDYLDPADRSAVLSDHALITNNRDVVRVRMRTLVDLLFEIGTADAGALAIGWMMLLCEPVAPTTFQQCVPQLQKIVR